MRHRPRVLPGPVGLPVLALVPTSRAAEFTGKVVGVSDGDTLTVLRDKAPVKVRLHGVDTPETGQDFGARAKAATSALAFGQVVTVRPLDTDRYGRTVGVVILPDGRSLNHELVRSGSAWWYREYAPGDSTLERLEREAREARRGLWAQAGPVAPWEWRHPASLPGDLAGKVVGNRRSHVYHRPGCPNAARIAEKNRVPFDSRGAAAAAGYRPGRDCHKD